MVTAHFFLMLARLLIEFVGEQVDRCIHVVCNGFGVQVGATGMNRGFGLLPDLLDTEHDVGADQVIEVSFDALEFVLHIVAQCIVEEQRAFLDYGDEAMRPLVLRDVSEQLGIHESTVSRATANKYMLTPRGLYEFKHFFSSHVQTTQGGVCSATAIQAMIKRMITAEDAAKPLSDATLSELLNKEGIQVARRTVAKYREGLNIPPSHERKPSPA